MICERSNLNFSLELFFLFFERFPETRPTFFDHPGRPRPQAWMHMWGEMMPKRGQQDFPTKISPDAQWILGSEADHMFIMVLCPYVVLDW